MVSGPVGAGSSNPWQPEPSPAVCRYWAVMRLRLLDEFVAVTGFYRKHAMRLLRCGDGWRICYGQAAIFRKAGASSSLKRRGESISINRSRCSCARQRHSVSPLRPK